MARKKTGHLRKMLKTEQANLAKLPKSQQAEYMKVWKEYAKEAKLADQAMRRLEGLSRHEHFKGVLKYAYKKAQKDAMRWSPNKNKDRFRFDTVAPATLKGLQNKLADIRNFMSKKSSSKEKILQTYQKRLDSLNKRHIDLFGKPSGLTWRDMADFWENNVMDKMEADMKNSDVAIMVVGAFKKMQPEIDKINKLQKKRPRYSKSRQAKVDEQLDEEQKVLNRKLKRLAPDKVIEAKIKILVEQGYDYHKILYGDLSQV